MIGARVDQFRADDELISALHNAARDYSFDFQVAGDCLGIKVTPLVVKDGGAGHDGKIRNLGQAID